MSGGSGEPDVVDGCVIREGYCSTDQVLQLESRLLRVLDRRHRLDARTKGFSTCFQPLAPGPTDKTCGGCPEGEGRGTSERTEDSRKGALDIE